MTGPQRVVRHEHQYAAALAYGFIGFWSFNLLIAFVPFYLSGRGWSATATGSLTGLFMLTAAIGPFLVPWLLGRLSLRATVASSLLLMGLPAAVYPFTMDPLTLAVVSLVRGLGFGFGSVAIGTAVAQAVAPARLPVALAWYGLVTSISTAAGQAGSIYLAERLGAGFVFALAALTVVVAQPLIWTTIAKSDRRPAGGGGSVAAVGELGLLGPTLVLTLAAAVYAAVVTFVGPLFASAGAHAAATYLLAVGLSMPLGRLVVGRWYRGSPTGVDLAALAACGVAIAVLPAVRDWPLIAAAGALYGFSFGVLVTNVLSQLAVRAAPDHLAVANVLFSGSWNFGMAAGGPAFGVLAGVGGFAEMFRISLACFGGAALVSVWDRRRTRPVVVPPLSEAAPIE